MILDTATAATSTMRQRTRFVEELAHFVRFPSVSAQRQHAADVRRCAEWLAAHLRKIGMAEVNTVPTPGLPIVYAETVTDHRRPTVLIYGHYDVQPADPVDKWRTNPFRPVVRGNNLYGRGASDDKGQLFAHVKALETYLRSARGLPVNVICLFEGEEEIGSPNLPAFLRQYRARLQADVAIVSDMSMLGPHSPAITYALRGALSLEVGVSGQKRDLHSGIFGGVVHNPLQALCEMLSRLHDGSGRIAIPGFYESVRRWPEGERRFMANAGPADSTILRNAGATQPWGEHGFSLYERATIRPSLSITGITGGYQGSGPKSVIPSHASAKLNFRLVPDQVPANIEHLVRCHLTAIAPPAVRVSVRTQSSARPALMDRRHPAMEAAATAYERGFGSRPVLVRSGGAIPVIDLLQQVLGIPTVLMGFGLPDDHVHGPNEKFHLPTYFNAIATSLAFLAEMAELVWRDAPRFGESLHGAVRRSTARRTRSEGG